ncbi:MAG: Crp/Fnr family transcriptional regulator [Candidatus Rokubacteria bacterium]|nr:Crp/Fnr family transcriptional regulator [Candidatus Rokubacteria bacterium]
MIEPLTILSRHPYFASLPATTLRAVGRRVVTRRYKKGAIIFAEAEPPRGLYLVCSGAVRVFKSSEDGKEQVLHHITPGQSFNDVAMFDGGPSPANAQAVEPTTVLLVSRAALLELMRRYPEIALAVIQGFAARLRQMSSLVEDLSLRHVVSRVAGVVLRLSNGTAVATLPTRQELAAMVGTVREVATRALRHLERLGSIRLGPARRATLLDRGTLQRLSGGAWPKSPVSAAQLGDRARHRI